MSLRDMKDLERRAMLDPDARRLLEQIRQVEKHAEYCKQQQKQTRKADRAKAFDAKMTRLTDTLFGWLPWVKRK